MVEMAADDFSVEQVQDLISGGAGADNVRGNAGEDILVDLDGGHSIWR